MIAVAAVALGIAFTLRMLLPEPGLHFFATRARPLA
jgi:hypothetical protein